MFTGFPEVHYTDFHVVRIYDVKAPVVNDSAEVDSPILLSIFNEFQQELDEARAKLAPNSPPLTVVGSNRKIPDDATSAQRRTDPITEVRADTILAYLKGLPTRTDDQRLSPDGVLLVWCETHGLGPDLVLSHKDEKGNPEILKRNDILATLDAIPHRLVILVTENCWGGNPGVVPAPVLNPQGFWRQLYFGHSGVVDIMSSGDKQKAYVVDGAVFTRAFLKAFDLQKDAITGGSPDKFVTWDKFFNNAIVPLTHIEYQDAVARLRSLEQPANQDNPKSQLLKNMIDQKTQDPQWFNPEKVRVLPP